MSDLIDRQAAIYACLNGWNKDFKEIMEDIKKLPPVKPEPCEDAISRQAVLDKEVYTETSDGWTGWTVDVNDIKALPPVRPEQKTGHWIREEHPDAMPTFTVTWRCSVCGKDQSYGEPPFCPNCGSYNGGDEE